MSKSPRILAFAGSLRKDSFNQRLVRLAARAAESAGAKVTVINLRDYPMPIFDEDLEAAIGLPEPAMKFRSLMYEHDGLLIACPEYNSSITAALKNTIDWASRPLPGEPPLKAFRGKAAALLSASPGALGGLRGLVHVRAILGNIGVIVLPDQIAVPRAHEVFNADGSLKDAKQQEAVDAIGRTLATTTAKLIA